MTIYRTADGRPRIECEDQLILETPLVRVGLFEARPGDPHFRDSGTPGEHLIAFPLTSVRLEMASLQPFVADRNTVIFYNPEQQYRRSVASLRGDRCHWLGLKPETIEQLFGAAGCRPGTTGDRLFPFVAGPCDTRSYELQLSLVKDLVSPTPPASLEVEERVLAIFRRVLGQACDFRGSDPTSSPRPNKWSESGRDFLAVHYTESFSLHDIAGSLGCSPYYLCRAFRRGTGTTLHAYRERLRLRRALLEIDDRRGDLTGLALDLGYSSHSHFTAAFRRMFGRPPSDWAPAAI